MADKKENDYILMKDLVNLWKDVSDWANGENDKDPKVKVDFPENQEVTDKQTREQIQTLTNRVEGLKDIVEEQQGEIKAVKVESFPESQKVEGKVSVDEIPDIKGEVKVSNLPSKQEVQDKDVMDQLGKLTNATKENKPSSNEEIESRLKSLEEKNDKLLGVLEKTAEANEKTNERLDKVISDDVVNTRLTGSNVEDGILVKNNGKRESETIINSETVEPGEKVHSSVSYKGEDEMWIAIYSDRRDWTARAKRAYDASYGHVSKDSLFPKRTREGRTSKYLPKTSLLINPVTDVENFSDAYITRWAGSSVIYVENYNDEALTVKVKIIRIWR